MGTLFDSESWHMICRNKRNSKNCANRYDWKAIQIYYDDGNSWKDVIKYFGVSSAALQKAKQRNQFKTRTISESNKLAFKKYGSKGMTLENRQKLSLEQSIRNRGGKSKWFMVSGQKVQGTWERNLALKFDQLRVTWVKLKTNKDVWPYIMDGKVKNYTPDFYLPEFNVYLDPKGYWWGDDKRKINSVKQQHVDKKLIIIEKSLYEYFLKSELNDIKKIFTSDAFIV